jgi:hypothetical protein
LAPYLQVVFGGTAVRYFMRVPPLARSMIGTAAFFDLIQRGGEKVLAKYTSERGRNSACDFNGMGW